MTHRFDFGKFTERARKTLQRALEEAQRSGHNYVGTEHILLGLIQEEDGVPALVLSSFGISRDQIRRAVELILQGEPSTRLSEIGLTAPSKRVIELAIKEARLLNLHYIGTEHILLGLLGEGDGIAAEVLKSKGLSVEKVREKIIEMPDFPAATQAGHQA
jgi:ATP-dependent Clp protease ATP-binding subunit ClpC